MHDRQALVLDVVRKSLDEAPRYDGKGVPPAEDIGAAFATLDHLRRVVAML